jgi:enamine deaminase RidA (YjgF/YER057c/UK114 family)
MSAQSDKRVLGQTSANYSLGIVAPAGRLVCVSGQVGMDPDGNVPAPYDLEAQTRQVFAQIEALLGEAGGSLTSIVKLTTFLTDMSRYPEFAKVRRELFSPPYPASTAVEVKGLIKPELLVEIEALAIV